MAARSDHVVEDDDQVVPAGLEELPAGAAPAAVLEGLDPARVSPADTVRVVAAAHRQLARSRSARPPRAVGLNGIARGR